MNFKYFKNEQSGEIFAFDIDDETQLPFMQAKVDEGLTDFTTSWTPPPEPPSIFEMPLPSKDQLIAELQALTAKIEALS